jgi:hypothetical protein
LKNMMDLRMVGIILISQIRNATMVTKNKNKRTIFFLL